MLTDIQKHMLKTFLWLRIGIGALGILFPFLLWFGGCAAYHLPLADSMSAYYHATTNCLDIHLEDENKKTGQCAVLVPPPSNPLCPELHPCPAKPVPAGEGPMRDWFVGVLFAIGVGLFLIKGFSVWEDWLLTIAGLLAVVVATNPMPWVTGKVTPMHVHYIAAVTFFVLIALVIWICSGKTLKFMPETTPDRDRWIAFFRHTYRALGFVMGLSPFAAILFFKIFKWPQGIFGAEAAGVISFGAYWLFKTWELSKSDAECRALKGEIEMNTMKLQ
jgi:hypothetical protein